MNASRYIKFRFLIDVEELKELIAPLKLVDLSKVRESSGPYCDSKALVESYDEALLQMREGRSPTIRVPHFGLTVDDEAVYAHEVPGSRYLMRAKKPVIMLGPSYFLMGLDGKIVMDSHSEQQVFIGLQVAYPQIFKPQGSEEVVRIYNHPDYPNGNAFRNMAKWLRRHTKLISINQIQTEFRLSEKVAKWIGNYENRITHNWR
ncbi:MAG: hypothetical protein MRY21_02650 [Simkaniaceae bacterium]|nr:hypothetical protein [Simkaniaceae bacterium]